MNINVTVGDLLVWNQDNTRSYPVRINDIGTLSFNRANSVKIFKNDVIIVEKIVDTNSGSRPRTIGSRNCLYNSDNDAIVLCRHIRTGTVHVLYESDAVKCE